MAGASGDEGAEGRDTGEPADSADGLAQQMEALTRAFVATFDYQARTDPRRLDPWVVDAAIILTALGVQRRLGGHSWAKQAARDAGKFLAASGQGLAFPRFPPLTRPESAAWFKKLIELALPQIVPTRADVERRSLRDQAREVVDLLLDHMSAVPALALGILPDLDSGWRSADTRERATEDVLRLLERSDERDLAEKLVRTILRAAGYPKRKAKNLFDAERKFEERRSK